MTGEHNTRATGTPINKRTEPHEFDVDCGTLHCYVHQVDEPDAIPDRGGTACGECNHAYRTGWELRRAYIRGGLELVGVDLRRPLRPPPGYAHHDDDPFGPPTRLPRLAALRQIPRLLLTPAAKITFCPHCIHDL